MSEVQDVFRQHGVAFINANKPPPHVCKAVRAIINCRTAALGGHVDVCDKCGHIKQSYNSCRNRHCPKCQALSKERWIMARNADLLPIPYFHVVFTLPEELNALVFANQAFIYNLLMKASAETLRQLCFNPKYLGAESGFISILHTWGQNLTLHPHVHIIIPGGGLTRDGRFLQCGKKFFIPVKVMAKLFRGKFLFLLNQSKRELNLRELDDDARWRRFLDVLYIKDWYVYCKRPFKSTNSVLQYLGRYTHRVAISNHRILNIQDDTVSFKWRDYRDGSKEKVMTLSSHEFMRRFLLHILPPGFMKIRHYGFLSSAAKKKKLALCKKLTGGKPLPALTEKLSIQALMLKLTDRDITLCPCCGVGHFVSYAGLSPPMAS